MKFTFEPLTAKQKISKRIFGLFLFSNQVKNTKKINSKFLNVFAIVSIAVFLLVFVANFLVFGGLIFYKSNHEKTIVSERIYPSVVLPSISKNSLTEIKQETIEIINEEKKPEEITKHYLFFIPFIFFLPIIFLIIVVHEFGHYIMLRRAGINAKRYGFGAMSIFCLPLFPIAFVDPDMKKLKKASKFNLFSVASAGITMNMFFGLFSLIGFIFYGGNFFELSFLLNIGIAMTNVLPIPFLDGSLFFNKISSKLNQFLFFGIIFMLVLLFA